MSSAAAALAFVQLFASFKHASKKKYQPSLKEKAISEALKPGADVLETARANDIPLDTLYYWIRRHRADSKQGQIIRLEQALWSLREDLHVKLSMIEKIIHGLER